MTAAPLHCDVAIVGGGVIGLAVAWRSAQRGLAVTVADPAPGRGAVWAAAGMLAAVTEVHYGEQALLALNLAAAQRWPSFAAELEAASGLAIGYRTDGTVVVARDRDDLEAIEELHTFQRDLGLDVERLTSRELRRLEPALAPSVRGGLHVPGDHQVDNRALAAALLAACRSAGVQIVPHAATAVRRDGGADGGRAVGITLDDGREVEAAQTVLAAGAWSRQLPGVPDGAVPVRPVKGQLLYLGGVGDQALLARNVRGLEVYLAPRRDGRIAVGATVEELGFDTQPRAGAVHELLRAARELVPGVDELAFSETVVGLRPGTPDNAPLLGPSTLPGLVVATGHFRNGVLLAPVTAEVIAALLADGALPAMAAAFTPARFASAVAGVAS